ncbi:hypothetical protein I7I50_01195 [Histoplasma capsulatum G186AR]|uniref:Uncharacterized protein n=1 Tax=Ajellomyces capsulatus TaxID=5037 RepID=A0A8H8D266_AJECA|nr:hypothetical protein I7I52_08979 [Histoplasma capsulatum]QSS73143.1 hypothetical protein I7I50_01195 [Histoplasma capsulatum G186AR]
MPYLPMKNAQTFSTKVYHFHRWRSKSGNCGESCPKTKRKSPKHAPSALGKIIKLLLLSTKSRKITTDMLDI